MITEDIPYGSYCYKIINIDEKRFIIHTKECPYWERIDKYHARCNFLKIQDNDEEDFLLWDQVKLCDINTYDNFIEFEDLKEEDF